MPTLPLTCRKAALLLLAIAIPLMAADSPEQQREKRLQWWRDARFGMFIHWGLYAVPAGEWNERPVPGLGEWIMNRAKIPVREYEQLAPQFNPVKFNADEWVAVAKNAGMKYIVITSKHHDGFAMFGSKASPYNIVDATPFHRDPLKELAAACKKAGLRLGFYYSQTQDWHESDAVGNDWDFTDESKKNFTRYLEAKVKPQVRELLTHYGPIGLIWFDTPRNITKEQSEELVTLVHQLQPDCLVSGRVGHGVGDYDSAGDNQISVGKVRRDWETPVTLNDTWGFKADDNNWKPASVLIRQLAQVASRGGNYLLNVGPTAEGLIPQPSVERLAEVGRWMKVNGESIYGSSPSPLPYELPWGVITTRSDRAYLHAFHWPANDFELYGVKNKVGRAYLLSSPARDLKVEQRYDETLDHYSLRLKTRAQAPDANDSVIVLETNGRPEAVTSLLQQPGRSVTLPAYLAEIHTGGEKGELRIDSRGVAERWLSKAEWMSWKFQVSSPGEFDLVVVTSGQKYGKDWEGGHRVNVEVAGKTLRGVVSDGGPIPNPSNPYWPYVLSKLERVAIAKTGTYELSLKPEKIEADKKLGLTLVYVGLLPRP